MYWGNAGLVVGITVSFESIFTRDFQLYIQGHTSWEPIISPGVLGNETHGDPSSVGLAAGGLTWVVVRSPPSFKVVKSTFFVCCLFK
jgi:hypothetical protein